MGRGKGRFLTMVHEEAPSARAVVLVFGEAVASLSRGGAFDDVGSKRTKAPDA